MLTRAYKNIAATVQIHKGIFCCLHHLVFLLGLLDLARYGNSCEILFYVFFCSIMFIKFFILYMTPRKGPSPPKEKIKMRVEKKRIKLN